MAIERFRSIEEMNGAAVRSSTANAIERFLRHCARLRRLSPPSHPRGVFKYRSLEEAQAQRMQEGACRGAGRC